MHTLTNKNTQHKSTLNEMRQITNLAHSTLPALALWKRSKKEIKLALLGTMVFIGVF